MSISLKTGDVVLVPCRVESGVADEEVRVKPVNGWSDCYAKVDSIKSVVSYNFQPGDWLTIKNDSNTRPLEVVMVEEDQIVVREVSGLTVLYSSNAMRADAPAPARAAIAAE